MTDKQSFLDALSLVNERDEWRKEFRSGVYERPWAIIHYQQNRQSELWRASRILEHLCEYTLHLEQMLGQAIKKKEE